MFTIYYHNNDTCDECMDGAFFDTFEDAEKWAQNHVQPNEYYFIEKENPAAYSNREMPELSNIRECMEEFFDYAESCGVGALL